MCVIKIYFKKLKKKMLNKICFFQSTSTNSIITLLQLCYLNILCCNDKDLERYVNIELWYRT